MAQIDNTASVLLQIIEEGTEISFKRETVMGQEGIRVRLCYCKDGNKIESIKYLPMIELPYLATALDEINLQHKNITKNAIN